MLAAGLPQSSRSIMKLSGLTVDSTTLLLAMAVDALNIANWMQSRDGRHNTNRPKRISKLLLTKKDNNDVQGFRDAVDFEIARERILRNAKEVEHNGD